MFKASHGLSALLFMAFAFFFVATSQGDDGIFPERPLNVSVDTLGNNIVLINNDTVEIIDHSINLYSDSIFTMDYNILSYNLGIGATDTLAFSDFMNQNNESFPDSIRPRIFIGTGSINGVSTSFNMSW